MKGAVYLYKMSVDAGAAPCVHRGLLSLAICKPQIRGRAKKGDLVFGFGANDFPMCNRLIYSISSKHVDFVFCDKNLAPVVALELDDSSHDDQARIDRDELVDGVLRQAALPLVRVRAKRGYVLAELRQLLAPHLNLSAPTVTEHPDEKYMPPKGWRPAV